MAGAVSLLGLALIALGVGGLLGIWALSSIFNEIEESAKNIGPVLEPYTMILTSLADVKGQGLNAVARSLGQIKSHIGALNVDNIKELKMAIEAAPTGGLGMDFTEVPDFKTMATDITTLQTIDLTNTIDQFRQLSEVTKQVEMPDLSALESLAESSLFNKVEVLSADITSAAVDMDSIVSAAEKLSAPTENSLVEQVNTLSTLDLANLISQINSLIEQINTLSTHDLTKIISQFNELGTSVATVDMSNVADLDLTNVTSQIASAEGMGEASTSLDIATNSMLNLAELSLALIDYWEMVDLTNFVSQIKTIADAINEVSTATSALKFDNLEQSSVLFDRLVAASTLDLSPTTTQVKQLVDAINKTTLDEAAAFSAAMDSLKTATIAAQAAPASPSKSKSENQGGAITVGPINITLDAGQIKDLIEKGATTASANAVKKFLGH